jgi:hypothetical protein
MALLENALELTSYPASDAAHERQQTSRVGLPLADDTFKISLGRDLAHSLEVNVVLESLQLELP